MSFFKKLFGKRKDDNRLISDIKEGEVVELSDGFVVKDGIISGEFSLFANGANSSLDFEMPIYDFMNRMEIKDAREQSLTSIDRELQNGDTAVPTEGFFDKYVMEITGFDKELSDELLSLYRHAKASGYNNIALKKIYKDKYDSFLQEKENRNKTISIINELNSNASLLEKSGDIDSAINIYEQSIAYSYPITKAYDRLMILYRKKKDVVNEKRVIKGVIDVLNNDSEQRARSVALNNPAFKGEIMLALSNGGRVFDSNGIYLFSPNSIQKYVLRLDKINNG